MYTAEYIDEIKSFNNDNLENLYDAKILITGGTGLLGSYLIDVLLFDSNFKGKVFLLVRDVSKAQERFKYFKNDERIVYISADISKKLDISIEEDIDYVFHLASFSDPANYAKYPVETMKLNLLGCSELLDLALSHNCKKFFFSSSVEVYGVSNLPMVETNSGDVNCLDVRSCYNESKRATETLCVSYEHEYKLPVYIGRFCRLYGPTMKRGDTKALSQFINKGLNNEDIVLKSKGEQLFSYLYVSDAISGMLTIMFQGESGEAYNVAESKDVMRLGEIAQLIANDCGKSVIYDIPSEAEKVGYSRAINAILPNEKLLSLGWQPTVKLENGIKKTIKVLKSFK